MSRIVEREESRQEYSLHHLIDDQDFSMGFHCHNFIEVYLSISGGRDFIIDDRIYNIRPGDLFVNNTLEAHRVIAREGERYERYVWEFKPSFVLPFCTEKTDLLHYVYKRPEHFSNRVPLSREQFSELTGLCSAYEQAEKASYGSDVLRRVLYIEMLTLIAGAYHDSEDVQREEGGSGNMDLIGQLMEYITGHISEDLSLDRLAEQAGLSKNHLCKVFRDQTGTTVNRYIVTRRIAEAKMLLAGGSSVTDACYGSGFNDLSHFIRTFHHAVGVTPGKFASQVDKDGIYYYIGPENQKRA